MDVFWRAPPVSRTLAAAVFGTSILVYSGILSGKYVIFYLPWLLKFPPDLWRLVTPFLITAPKLGIVLDPYFIYTYGSALETDSPKFTQPGDLFVYLVFVCAVIIITSGAFFGGVIFTPALVLALAYTYAQDNPNKKMTYFVVSFRLRWLPYVMLLMTFIMDSPESALTQTAGLIAAHLYEFLTRLWPTFGGGQNPIWTPQFVRRWFISGGPGSTATSRGYGTAFTRGPAPPGGRETSTGVSSGFSGFTGSWGGRGSGRRLGGD